MTTNVRVIFCIFVLFVSLTALGAPPDVIVSGTDYVPGILPLPYPPWVYPIEWGNLWSEVPSEPYTGFVMIAAGGHGRLLAIASSELPPFHFSILEIRADKTRTELFSSDSFIGNGLVADAAGNIFVLATSPASTQIFVLNATGTLLRTHPVGGGGEAFFARMDLASDQCTLFYQLAGLHRFNVCTGTPLPDFPAAGGHPAILPDGDVLLSWDNHLRRYDQSGLLVRTYSLGTPLFAGPHAGPVGLGADGHRALVMIGEDRQLREVDLDSGAVIVRPEYLTAVGGYATAIVPIDGWTAALGSAAAIATTDIPALSASTLAALFVLLAFVALRRLTF